MAKSTRVALPPASASTLKHSKPTIALHWLSVLLVIGAASTILIRELVEGGSLRTLLLDSHRQFGLLVLLALSARLAARFTFGMAPTLNGSPWLVRWAAHAAHWGLYGVLLAIPMLGWALSSAHGVQLKLLGLVPLSALVGADADLADQLTDLHVLGSWLMLGMVTLHVAAALYHHVVRKDAVLTAMLPGDTATPDSTAAGDAGTTAPLRRVA